MTTSGESEPDNSPQPALTEYIVVLRARSAARFLPEEGFELNLEPPTEADPPAARVRMFTRWVASGHAESLPRELIIELQGRAPSIDAAIVRFAGIARPMATLAAFVANVRVGPIEVHLAYDCTPDSEERQFVETFLVDETGAVTEGRIVRVHLMLAASQALLATENDRQERLDRALRQYELALREWFVGGESLALSHLYMAVDALTPAMIKKLMADRGLTKEELAQSVGIDPHDPKRPRWRQALEVWCRAEIIFAGDSETYQAAKTASDGLEHGSLDINAIHQYALNVTDKTFGYVRRAIVDLIELPAELRDELMTIKPKDVQSRRKIVRGRLVGKGADPAPDDQQYPRLEWSSSIGSVLRDGPNFTISDQDKITVRPAPASVSSWIDSKSSAVLWTAKHRFSSVMRTCRLFLRPHRGRRSCLLRSCPWSTVPQRLVSTSRRPSPACWRSTCSARPQRSSKVRRR